MDGSILALMIVSIVMLVPLSAILVAPITKGIAAKERKQALDAYERIVKEKLEVLSNAITMGYQGDDLKNLDARLEKLIGKEKLETLIDRSKKKKKGKSGSEELVDVDLDLDDEIERLTGDRVRE